MPDPGCLKKGLIDDSIYAILNIMNEKEILSNPKNVSFQDLLKICEKHFGKPRIRGSHHIFKTLAGRPEDQYTEGRQDGQAVPG